MQTADNDFTYDISLQKSVVEQLLEKNLTVATAESCTAGYISKRITDISGASAVFGCGVVTYSNEIKHKLLGVNESLFQTVGAVSSEVATQMAKGVRTLSGSDIGLGITGIAGPNSDGTDKPVGLCYIALGDKHGEYCIKYQADPSDTREHIRYAFSTRALELLKEYLDCPEKLLN